MFDRTTFVPIDRAATTTFFTNGIEGESAANLVRWGADGLAFRTTDRFGGSMPDGRGPHLPEPSVQR